MITCNLDYNKNNNREKVNMIKTQTKQEAMQGEDLSAWDNGYINVTSLKNRTIKTDKPIRALFDVTNCDIECKDLVATDIKGSTISAEQDVLATHNIDRSTIEASKVEAHNAITESDITADTVISWVIRNSEIICHTGKVFGKMIESHVNDNEPQNMLGIELDTPANDNELIDISELLKQIKSGTNSIVLPKDTPLPLKKKLLAALMPFMSKNKQKVKGV